MPYKLAILTKILLVVIAISTYI